MSTTAAKKPRGAKAVENPTFMIAVLCAVGVLIASGGTMIGVAIFGDDSPTPTTKADQLFGVAEKAFFMVLGALLGVFAGKASGTNGSG